MTRRSNGRRTPRTVWSAVAVTLTLVASSQLATVAAPARPPEPAVPDLNRPAVASAEPECVPYLLIGLRSSGQAMDGPFQMGGTVGVVAQAAYDDLPDGQRSGYSVPYPAVPVSLEYDESVSAGVTLLVSAVRGLVVDCPGIRIGVIGYSQGANVVNIALRRLTIAERASVRGVLLLSDPADAGDTAYDRYVTVAGEPGSHAGGGVLNRGTLPPDIQGRTTAFCLTGDPICDSPEAWGLPWAISEGVFLGPIHSMYANCCPGFPLISLLGAELAQRLLGQDSPPPAQCQPAVTGVAWPRPRAETDPPQRCN